MSNNKFIWNGDEIKFVSPNAITIQYKQDNMPYAECQYNGFCKNSCKHRDKAKQIAEKIFDSYCTDNMPLTDLQKVLKSLVTLAKEFVDSETALTKGLYYCTKIHLLQLIDEKTDILLDDEFYKKAFEKAIKK